VPRKTKRGGGTGRPHKQSKKKEVESTFHTKDINYKSPGLTPIEEKGLGGRKQEDPCPPPKEKKNRFFVVPDNPGSPWTGKGKKKKKNKKGRERKSDIQKEGKLRIAANVEKGLQRERGSSS